MATPSSIRGVIWESIATRAKAVSIASEAQDYREQSAAGEPGTGWASVPFRVGPAWLGGASAVTSLWPSNACPEVRSPPNEAVGKPADERSVSPCTATRAIAIKSVPFGAGAPRAGVGAAATARQERSSPLPSRELFDVVDQ